MENNKQYKASDFKKGQPRWCPGCGDHFFLSSFLKALEEIGATPYDTVVVSGIGCSGRLPYYVNTYALQTIHGRAAAIATGIKVVNPKLSVWQVSGDGDGLAIGGNHFIHANRRNVDLNMVILMVRLWIKSCLGDIMGISLAMPTEQLQILGLKQCGLERIKSFWLFHLR